MGAIKVIASFSTSDIAIWHRLPLRTISPFGTIDIPLGTVSAASLHAMHPRRQGGHVARRTREILRVMEAGMPRGAIARAPSVSKHGARAVAEAAGEKGN